MNITWSSVAVVAPHTSTDADRCWCARIRTPSMPAAGCYYYRSAAGAYAHAFVSLLEGAEVSVRPPPSPGAPERTRGRVPHPHTRKEPVCPTSGTTHKTG